jgi:hypothetical protein
MAIGMKLYMNEGHGGACVRVRVCGAPRTLLRCAVRDMCPIGNGPIARTMLYTTVLFSRPGRTPHFHLTEDHADNSDDLSYFVNKSSHRNPRQHERTTSCLNVPSHALKVDPVFELHEGGGTRGRVLAAGVCQYMHDLVC